MSGNEEDPWTGFDDDEEGGFMVKVFILRDEESLALDTMREGVGNLAADLKKVIENEGWDADAVVTAIQDINFFLERGHEKFRGYLLSGMIRRKKQINKEFVLPKDIRKVRYQQSCMCFKIVAVF
jgi:hypothetical protein